MHDKLESYRKFLDAKTVRFDACGFDAPPEELHEVLFPWQRSVVSWALAKGRSALFEDCGLGKTVQSLEWSARVMDRFAKSVLILAPVAVASQTEAMAVEYGMECKHVRGESECDGAGIYITNYERLHLFSPEFIASLGGIVLDESSILKSMDGKTRTMLIETFAGVPMRLCCTATPAPNDLMEIGNHSEFLGVMRCVEMLAMFFDHDGGETSKWVLKPHATKPFWKWVCSWAVYIRKPSDIGFSDEGYNLSPLHLHEIVIPSDQHDVEETGELFAGGSLTLAERRAARRDTIDRRVAACAAIANAIDGQCIVWCDLNAESSALTAAIDGAVEITGSQSETVKETRLMDFAAGRSRRVVTKGSIAGFGMNFQGCANEILCGLSDSYETIYQCIRRCWRFGQKNPVNVYVVTHEREGAVVANIKRKESQAMEMANQMIENMRKEQAREFAHATRDESTYRRDVATGADWTLHLGDSCEVICDVPSDSIHYTIFSPPFASLYTYSNSPRDMGNSADHSEFYEHFEFLVGEMFRVTMPGRLLSFHCMNLPTSKVKDGVIGIRDFRGELIRMFQAAGFVYHSEVCIWKDPVTAMQRTKALGLLHKQIKKDSCMSRQGIPDYLVTMRKPGENPEPVTNTNDTFPVSMWQRYASPVWMDINPNETLQFRSARENEGERHICPLQLEVIRRAIRLWSNEGDTVASWFAGIGSEGHEALRMGRKFFGCELKESYWRCAAKNLSAARYETGDMFGASDTELAEA